MRRVIIIFLVVCLVVGTASPVAGTGHTGVADDPDTAVTGVPADATTGIGTPETATSAASTSTTTITILSYNDIQTAAAENRTFPRLITAIKERRAAIGANKTVVVGAGDEVSPHALSPISQWRAPVEVLNTVDPAADVIGNHEFDYGFDTVSNFTGASEFPWLVTNIVNSTTGEPVEGTKAYEIVERKGVRVGIIGLIDRGAAEGKTNIDLSQQGATLENYTKDGPATAAMLKRDKNVDVVIALAHTGVPDAKFLASKDEEDAIDVIAVGDDEIKFPPQKDNGSIITEAQARAAFLGELNLTVNTTTNDVVGFDGRLIPIDETFEKDPTASRIISEFRAEVSLDSPIGNTTTPLDSRFATNFHRESAYGNLITDAMRAETGANVAITNAGGIRSDTIYAENATADNPVPITGGIVFNTLPFANTLVTFNLTGDQLKEILASQIVTLESETGQQFGQEISQQVSGVRFEWVGHDPDPEIRDVYVNMAGPDAPPQWEKVRANETYTVTVNSFMAAGGSGYPLPENKTIASRTDKLLAVTVINYIKRQGTVSPSVEGRMQRVDRDLSDAEITLNDAGKVVLTFDTPTDFTELRTDTVAVVPKAPGAGTVAAEQVVTNPNRIIVRFDDPALTDLVDDGDEAVELDLYAKYNSSEFDPKRVFFADSRLNSDLTADIDVENDRRGRPADRSRSTGRTIAPAENRLPAAGV